VKWLTRAEYGFCGEPRGNFRRGPSRGRRQGARARPGQDAHAIAISGTCNVLAGRGITGPALVFEGNKGFKQAIAGRFEIDWAVEDLERVRRTIIKKYNAEIHAQAAIEGVLDLRRAYGFATEDVDRVEIEMFQVAYNIIGGGEERDKDDGVLEGEGRPQPALYGGGHSAGRRGAPGAVRTRAHWQ
jgi:hypothetical protein